MPRYMRKKDGEKAREAQAENELRKAQQQFRILEASRRAYNKRAKRCIENQQKEISSLHQERKEITLNISLTNTQRNISLDSNNVTELRDLLEIKDQYDAIIEEEKALISKLDIKIKEMEEKISSQKRIVSGVTTINRSQNLNKRIKMLEAQLDHVTTNFNMMLVMNAKLRKDIDHLRSQRGAFDAFYQKLLKELHQQKIAMDAVIGQSMQAHDQREENQARIQAMKERCAKDLNQYNIEIKELVRTFDHEKKLRGFMQIKSFDRSELDGEEIRLKREALAEEKALKARADVIESYQVTYKQLVALSGEEDMETLIGQFVENEEKNFASYSFMNELNNEVVRLQEKIKVLEDEIINLQSQQNQSLEETHVTLKQVEAKLQKTTEDANIYEQGYKENNKLLDQLITAVDSLFTTFHCDPSSVKELLGGSEGLTYLNVMQYFSILEKKTDELLQIQAYLHIKDLPEKPWDHSSVRLNPFLGGSDLLSLVAPIKISSPVLEEDLETEITDDPVPRILDHTDLRKMVLLDLLTKKQFKGASLDKPEETYKSNKRYRKGKRRAVTA
ncbi:coiled-coil domain-containing protein 63 [Ascaphus truei]|uniref:coiled-coil domain-containing protein 63 n=1 Tax=Ascaphus truei TaxID=8439 RepID=UPI003F59F1BE